MILQTWFFMKVDVEEIRAEIMESHRFSLIIVMIGLKKSIRIASTGTSDLDIPVRWHCGWNYRLRRIFLIGVISSWPEMIEFWFQKEFNSLLLKNLAKIGSNFDVHGVTDSVHVLNNDYLSLQISKPNVRPVTGLSFCFMNCPKSIDTSLVIIPRILN